VAVAWEAMAYRQGNESGEGWGGDADSYLLQKFGEKPATGFCPGRYLTAPMHAVLLCGRRAGFVLDTQLALTPKAAGTADNQGRPYVAWTGARPSASERDLGGPYRVLVGPHRTGG